jgi:XrtJ-associated TM-motif-TM protein
MKNIKPIALILGLLLTPVLAHAQSGCVTSPECPTAILGLVGSAGAAFVSVRNRLRK